MHQESIPTVEATPITSNRSKPLSISESDFLNMVNGNDTPVNIARDHFIREKLNGRLSTLYELEIALPIRPASILQRLGMIFSQHPESRPQPETTTLKRYFLQKMNDPATTSGYKDQIYNSLVAGGNPASFFIFDDPRTTVEICNIAYREYMALSELPQANISLSTP